MRALALSKNGINKVRAHQYELKVTDFEDSVKSLPPGEWCLLKVAPTEFFVGFVNPLIDERYACAQVLSKVSVDEAKSFSAKAFVLGRITSAFEKRKRISGYGNNSRIFYGVSDGLPGLIIDQFENAGIIQINTSGVDKFRDDIQKLVSELSGTKAFLLDNAKYREKESLPTFETEPLPELHVLENGLRYKIRAEVLQKVGFYYDHRENRLQLMQFLSRISSKPKKGIDLFCYAGAWGMSALKAGVSEVHFVDQGEFSVEVEEALKLNGFSSQGQFFRTDVFRFLDEAVQKNTKYDLILCDPPAFAKSPTQKPQALEGYSKLHRKVFKALASSSVVAFSSCTHYVGHEEFQKNILDAATKENRKIQLVYSGIQGLDHPVTSLDDRSNYIKSYFYLVE